MALDKRLQQELATINHDFLTFSGTLGQRQMNPNHVLRNRGSGLGLEIYDQIEQDAHAFAVLDKRKRAVAQKGLCHVVASTDSALDQKATEFVREQLENLAIPEDPNVSELALKGFEGIRYCQMDAILKGYSVAETIWAPGNSGVVGNALLCDRILPKPQRMFGFAYTDNGWETRLLTRDNPYEGIVVPQRKFIVYTFGDKDGNPHGIGLGEPLFWTTFFKRQDVSFWLMMAEIVAKRVPKGEYPTNASEEEKRVLLEAVEAITAGSGAIVPVGMVLNVLDAVNAGTDTHEKLCRYLDEQASECVLGETGTTNQSGPVGSNAKDKVGNEVRLETRNSDCDLLNEVWNRTIVRWMTANFSDQANPPRIERIPDPEDLTQRVTRDKTLFEMGFRLKEEAVKRIYGDDYELIQTAQPALPPDIPASQKTVNAQFSEVNDDVVGALVQQRVDAYKARFVNHVESLIENSDDLTEFAEKVNEIY